MTPLAAFLRAATAAERERCALLAGTSVSYLYQLAGCHRKNPGSALANGIAQATTTLHAESGGRLPALSVETLATMCAMAGFDDLGSA